MLDPITFPQGFRISKDIGHPTSASGGKKTVKKTENRRRPKKVKKKTLFLRGDFRQFSNENVLIWDHFFPLLFPQGFRISKNIGHPTLGSGGKKTVKKDQKPKKTKKIEEKNFFLRGDFRQFSNKNVFIWDQFFPLLFPKDSESLKILDIRLREVGAKRRLNGTSKVNRQTDTQTHRPTDRQTDILNYRKHRPRGPMLWEKKNLRGPPLVLTIYSILSFLCFWNWFWQDMTIYLLQESPYIWSVRSLRLVLGFVWQETAAISLLLAARLLSQVV